MFDFRLYSTRVGEKNHNANYFSPPCTSKQTYDYLPYSKLFIELVALTAVKWGCVGGNMVNTNTVHDFFLLAAVTCCLVIFVISPAITLIMHILYHLVIK